MANIEISKGNAPAKTPVADTFDALRAEMNRLFDAFDRGWPTLPSLFQAGRGGTFGLDLDIRDDGKEFVIEADLPGLSEKDVTLKLANGVLTISGERSDKREEKKANYYVSERSFGSFMRQIRLPETVDESKIDARFDKGVLKITAPKKPEAVKSERTIEVKSG
jgi:HSP20 family protein